MDGDTVQGQLQGPISKVHHRQEHLEIRGCPKSHVDTANFKNEKIVCSHATLDKPDPV